MNHFENGRKRALRRFENEFSPEAQPTVCVHAPRGLHKHEWEIIPIEDRRLGATYKCKYCGKEV